MFSSEDALKLVMRRFRQRLRIDFEVRKAKQTGDVCPDAVEFVSLSGKRVWVERPEDWLMVCSRTYDAFRSDPVCPAIREWCDGCKSATVAAELNGISRRVFYERQRVFFGFALAMASELKLVEW